MRRTTASYFERLFLLVIFLISTISTRALPVQAQAPSAGATAAVTLVSTGSARVTAAQSAAGKRCEREALLSGTALVGVQVFRPVGVAPT